MAADFSGIRVLFNCRVPMRDGIELSADVYMSTETWEKKRVCSVVLMRTPYVKASVKTAETATTFAKNGFVFVAMDVRGRGDSDGEFVPWANEGVDGYDAIEWCARQPWSNENVGTMGGSYPGCIQWQAAILQPPHLKAMIVAVSPADPFVENPSGMPSPTGLCWLHFVSGKVLQPMEIPQWEKIYEHLPLYTMDECLGPIIPRWRDEIDHAQLDAWWNHRCYQQHFDRVNVPVLHVSGWYDDEEIGTPQNFIGMTSSAATPEARKNQRLLMGPWGHQINTTSKLGEVEFGPQSLIDLRGEELRWFKRWLNNEPVELGAPVRIFVMGKNEWRDEQEWPIARTEYVPFYLHSSGQANSRYGDGTLSPDVPRADEAADTYRSDPETPVPFITAPTSSQIGGPDNYAAVQRRDDVLVYVSDVLKEDTEVTGPVRMQLYASSSATDTDFMVMLLDVWPNGFRQRLCDSMVRTRFRDGMERPSPITPGEIYPYAIPCWDTSHVLKKGHRICVALSSSAFPKYDRNLNNGGALGKDPTIVVADQRVYHNAAHPSAIILPLARVLDR